MKRGLALVLFLLPALAAGAEHSRDFAHGMPLAVSAAQPVQELTLPDAVYRGVLRADLGDLRVFNGAGSVVPYALCAARQPDAPERWRSRPLYRLERAGAETPRAALELEVSGADGTRVQLRGAPATEDAPAGAAIFGYIIDAGNAPGLVHALRLDGETGDRPAELRLRVSGSDDLRTWTALNDAGLLLLAHGDDAALRLDEVPLRPARHRYLRVLPASGGALPAFRGAAIRVQADADVEPRWVTPPRNGPAGRDGGVAFAWDSERLAPVSQARILLPAENMSLVVALDSRAHLDQPWQQRGRREVHRLRGMPAADNSLRFPPRADRWWRLRVLRGAETLAGAVPTLELGYVPAQLRFLTQGEGPWMLAFGSARAQPAGQDCAELLGGTPAAQLTRITGAAAPAGAVREMGGAAALEPPREPVPLARWLFWIVLVLGVALLLALSLSLLRRMRS